MRHKGKWRISVVKNSKPNNPNQRNVEQKITPQAQISKSSPAVPQNISKDQNLKPPPNNSSPPSNKQENVPQKDQPKGATLGLLFLGLGTVSAAAIGTETHYYWLIL